MKLDVISEKDNPLRKRKEYWLLADHAGEGTPPRHSLLPQVAKELGLKEELIVLDKIFSERGKPSSRLKVLVYSDKLEVPREKTERQQRKVKKFLEKKEKAEAQPAPEEAPAEGGEKAEEKPEEPSEEPAPDEEPPAEEPEGEKPAEESPEPDSEEKGGPKSEEPAPKEEPKKEDNKEEGREEE
jgi:ribosomal protein S24E